MKLWLLKVIDDVQATCFTPLLCQDLSPKVETSIFPHLHVDISGVKLDENSSTTVGMVKQLFLPRLQSRLHSETRKVQCR